MTIDEMVAKHRLGGDGYCTECDPLVAHPCAALWEAQSPDVIAANPRLPDASLMAFRWDLIAKIEADAATVEASDPEKAGTLRREARARRNAIAADSHHIPSDEVT